MMTAAQKTVFGNLFKQKKFIEIPNAVYRVWLGFKIAAMGSEEIAAAVKNRVAD